MALPTLVVLAVGSVGCLIERQNLQGPIDDDANLQGVDAPGLDAWRPDAFTATDAFHPNDAFTSLDAFTPDAFVVPDAFTRPDAFIPPDTGCNGRDDDADGLRDPCDPWPCGAMVPAIGSSVTGSTITMSNVRINGGGNTAIARSGVTLGVNMRYQIVDGDCPGCIKQIEVGSVPGQYEACIYDANPPGGSGASANESADFQMPTVSVPTRVDLRFNLRQDYECRTNWSGGPPPERQTFGVVCVIP